MHHQAQQIGQHLYVPATAYTFDELADIYNQARVDYIVPMPMNGKRMAEYVEHYDVDLSASAVSLTADQQPSGVVMTGIRGDRSWITRLGVVPTTRGHKVGEFLAQYSIQQARQRKLARVQLEVIKGNEPAHQLFLKLGFVEFRDLLVIRRPPGAPDATMELPGTVFEPIPAEKIPACLAVQDTSAAWTEEAASLRHLISVKGYYGTLPTGESGWVIYQLLPFQITHIVVQPGLSDDLAQALLHHIHKQHPMHDTKVENLPFDHAHWPAYQKVGYIEAFARHEMFLPLK